MKWKLVLMEMVVFEKVPVTLLAVSTVKVSPTKRLPWNPAATVKLIVPARAAVPETVIWLKPEPTGAVEAWKQCYRLIRIAGTKMT